MKFNSSVSQLNTSLFNPENLDFYIVPAQDYHLEVGFNKSLNFSYSSAWTNSKELKFQLNFENPITISPLFEQDKIVLHFREPLRTLIFSSELKNSLHESAWTLKSNIKKQ